MSARARTSLRKSPRYHEPDWWLLSILLTLVMFGTVMVFSASFPQTAAATGLARYEELIRQLAYVAVGGVGMLIATRIDYHRYARFAFPGLLLTMLLLAALVFVPGVGTEIYGAKAWILVGPVSFQPAEVAKLAMILYMATWFAGKGARIRSISYGLVQFSVLMGVLVGLLMLQPDLGTATLLVTVGIAMFFVAGAHLLHFATFIIFGSAAFLALALSAPYRRDRLLVFLNPDSDIRNLGWQLFQARLALGSGGLFGVGLGASRQKFSWLPAADHDAIFAVIGEELGLAGCAFVLLLFVTFAWRGYQIARRAPDTLGTLIAVGITTWIIFQAAFNIGGVTLAIPFTGIPLPFISAGGTALAVAMVSVGILINISRQTLSAAELAPRRASSSTDASGGGTPRRATRPAHPTPATSRNRARTRSQPQP
ncbi:MAG TPA: putative lipid II flippase FtsW, partial [Thermomicrobiales bacterium]|nr:putative lipid II flippase FtsW [Thermomicrobiales bacterium]